MMRRQDGYFLILAVILIMLVGLMGVIISSSFVNRARLSVDQQQGLQAFYIAESGLEIASRLLVGTGLVSGQGLTCATLTGAPAVTNASLLGGTFTAQAVGGALYSAASTLAANISSSSNTMTLASTSGFAPHGRVRIDSEAIDYASVSGNTLVGLNRGVAGTAAASHVLSAGVSQSVCLVNVQAGIPSIVSPRYQRQLEMAVEILENSDIWAVGNRHGNTFSVIRWNTPLAGVWNDAAPDSDTANRDNLLAVSLSSNTNGWAVGLQKGSNFTFMRWNGSAWTAAPLSGACSNQDLAGVAVTSTIEAWAVGYRYRPNCANSGNYRYTLLRWNGAAWSILTPSTSPSIPNDAAANQNLNAVDVYDSNNDGLADIGFAVGNTGTILRYNGSAWQVSASGVTNNLFGVDVVSGIEAWAVGAGGRILRWYNNTWNIVASQTTAQLNAVSMVDTNGDGIADAGWAVGNGGTIIYYNGNSWSPQTSSTSNNLTGVAALSASSAFAVGASNTLLKYAGSWSAATPPTTFSVSYNGMGFIPGGVVVTGSQVGSWQQIFN